MEKDYRPQSQEQSLASEQSLPFPAPGQVMKFANEKNTFEITTKENGEIRFRVASGETVIFNASVHENKVRFAFDAAPIPESSPIPITETSPVPLAAPASIETTTAQATQSVEQKIASTEENKEKQKAVMLYGNIGKAISRKPAKDGRPMVTFQLAEHPTRYKDTFYHEQKKRGEAPLMQDRTVWRKVAAFGTFTEQVTDIQPGQEVKVTAYPKEREVKHRDGTTGYTTDFFLIGIEDIKKS